jgi:hypothetical protein
MEKSLNDINSASGCHGVTPEHEPSSCFTHNDQLGLVYVQIPIHVFEFNLIEFQVACNGSGVCYKLIS